MKKGIIAVLLTLSLTASLFALFGCNGFSQKQVPVYQGMTISNAVSTAKAASYASDGKEDFDYDGDNGNHNGHFKGDHADRNEDIDGENPFPENESDENIEEEIKSSLDVVGSPVEIYYATPGQDIYINIHIDNPDSFEILSFTLNGQKYSSYMFEDGSDMEKIILKYNVGYASGIVEYTIDAIKYVDGTEIKDVTIGGDKTVRAGIRTDNQVSAELSDVAADTDSISFDATVLDNDGLISKSDGFIKAVLYNGETLVSHKDLSLGENEVEFDSLKANTLYQYVVVGYYDDLSGEGRRLVVFEKGAVYTDAAVLFEDITVEVDEISFGLLWNEEHPTKTLTSLKLYHGADLLTTLDTGATSVSGLTSNTSYSLVAEYDNLGKSESIRLEFTTASRAEPSFALTDTMISSSGIISGLSVVDKDGTLSDYKVGIYSENTLVSESSGGEISFTSLNSYTEYSIRIEYSFDLGDGEGLQTNIYKFDFKTHPYIDVLSCDIINTGAVSVGDTVYMEIGIDNPLGASVSSVVIGDTAYAVTGTSTNTRVYVEILLDDRFSGGATEFKVEKINVVAGEESFSVIPASIRSDEVFINGALKVLGAELVNEDFEPVSWAFPSDKVYVLVTLDNETGYTVDSINSSNQGLVKLDDNRWYYPAGISGGWNSRYISTLEYHNEYVSKTLTLTGMATGSCYVLSSSEVVYVSDPSDLKTMSGGYYYELTGDIDLSGISWQPSDFAGVFDGKGYAIKNMSFVGNVKNQSSYFGLFAMATGVIQNLNIENARIMANVSADDDGRYKIYGGMIAAATSSMQNLSLVNCAVDGSSSISIKSLAGDCFVGGLVGLCNGGILVVSRCENRASVESSSYSVGEPDLSMPSNVTAVAGGIVGRVGGFDGHTFISDTANYGAVTASGDAYLNVGGIVGSVEYNASLTVKQSLNVANAYARDGANVYVGGVLGYAAAYSEIEIVDCVNAGIVDSNMLNQCVGGIAGYSYSMTELLVDNSHSVMYGNGVGGILCTEEQLSTAAFYTDTLGWSEDVWSFSNLDADGGKYPELK